MEVKRVLMKNIPRAAWAAERAARAAQPSETSGYVLVAVRGYHGKPEAPIEGYVESLEAAQAISAWVTTLPDGSRHRTTTYRPW